MGLFSKKDKQEGLIETYDITYLGGHPSFPKAKLGKIVLNIFKSNFEFVSTIGGIKNIAVLY